MKDIEKHFKGTSTGEHIINILKAAASLNPYTGVIAALITDYIPNQRMNRIEEFAKGFAEDLERFKNEVNDDYIKTDEFAFIFERCFKGAMDNYQAEKVQAFRAVLVNSLRANGLQQNEKEFFLSLIDRLSTIHIRVLWFLSKPEDYLRGHGLPETNVEGSFSQFFPRVMPDVTLEFVKLVFQDLYSYGLIKVDKGIFGTMTVSSGYGLLANRVTEIGDSFIEFISLSE